MGTLFKRRGRVGVWGDLWVGDGYRVGDKGIPPNLPPARTSRLSIYIKGVLFQNGLRQLLFDLVV